MKRRPSDHYSILSLEERHSKRANSITFLHTALDFPGSPSPKSSHWVTIPLHRLLPVCTVIPIKAATRQLAVYSTATSSSNQLWGGYDEPGVLELSEVQVYRELTRDCRNVLPWMDSILYMTFLAS